MSDIGQDAGQQPVDRKELLSQQFSEVEQSVQQATPDKVPLSAAPDDRPRDPAGKFVAKELVLDKSPVVAAPVSGTPAAVAVPLVVEEPVWNKAPASWKKDKHQLWAAMTPEQKEYAFQREEQMRSGVEPLLPKAELADKITRVAEPFMNTIRGMGIDLTTAIGGLMQADHDLRTLPYEQKMQRLQGLAMTYGIDLSGQMQGAQPAYGPAVQAIQNELLGIKGQFASFTQAQEAQQQRAATDEIQKFSQTAEHFDEVKPLMAQLLQGGLADGISDAYEKAVRLSPEIFYQIQSAKQAAADVEKRAVADAAAKRARAAAVSVRSATPGTTKATNAQDRRSMLAEQIGGLSERL